MVFNVSGDVIKIGNNVFDEDASSKKKVVDYKDSDNMCDLFTEKNDHVIPLHGAKSTNLKKSMMSIFLFNQKH